MIFTILTDWRFLKYFDDKIRFQRAEPRLKRFRDGEYEKKVK